MAERMPSSGMKVLGTVPAENGLPALTVLGKADTSRSADDLADRAAGAG